MNYFSIEFRWAFVVEAGPLIVFHAEAQRILLLAQVCLTVSWWMFESNESRSDRLVPTLPCENIQIPLFLPHAFV